jgi:hypothetical protein
VQQRAAGPERVSDLSAYEQMDSSSSLRRKPEPRNVIAPTSPRQTDQYAEEVNWIPAFAGMTDLTTLGANSSQTLRLTCFYKIR